MAAVRGRLPLPKQAGKTSTAVGRRRILLPSSRCAEFAEPTVGEFMDLREAALVATAGEGGSKLTFEFGRQLLRRCLVGLSAGPVPQMRRPVDAAAVQAALEQAAAKDTRIPVQAGTAAVVELGGMMLRGESAEAQGERADALAAEHAGLDGDALLRLADEATEDTVAMKAGARLEPVTDYAWNEAEGVGAYLASLPAAAMGTPEAADYQALHDYAALQFSVGLSSPKAPTRANPIRRLR